MSQKHTKNMTSTSKERIIRGRMARQRLSEFAKTDIYDRFDASAPAISQHLKVLRKAKLVRVDRKGQLRNYQIDLKGMGEIEQWSMRMTHLWKKIRCICE